MVAFKEEVEERGANSAEIVDIEERNGRLRYTAKKSWGHGIEPTTSRLEPGSLTTRSTGSLFDIVGDFGAVPGPWFF